MSLGGWLVSWFPLLHGASVVAAAGACVRTPSWERALWVPVALYLLPVLAFRLHSYALPLCEGDSRLREGYSRWYAGHMFQLVFIAFPVLEAVLLIIPGAFALWLRLWGSRVGRGVHFAPGFLVGDRSLLDIGDRAIFGYGVQISGHIITPSARFGGLRLRVRRVRIGEGAFIGAGCRIGPGVVVEPRSVVRAASDLYPGKVVRT